MSDSGGNVGGLASAGGNAETPAAAGELRRAEGKEKTSWGLWAVYLGVSWTWCIGMFLPALLWRDFGVWSFVVFVLPNIVGAAALGLVMKSPEASRAFMERHRWACFAFSAVTVAFQVFFAAWVARVMGGGAWHLGWVACAAAPLLSAGNARFRRLAALVGGVVWLASAVTIAVTVSREAEGGMLTDLPTWPGVRPVHELVPLAMVCLLGFGLCPYLDRTFHRGRIETGRASVRAFGLGFGFFFALMIVGTLLTAPALLWITGASGSLGGPPVGQLLIALFACHTVPQLVYTCWVHGGEARSNGERVGLGLVALAVGLGVMLAGAGALVHQYGREESGLGWADPLFGGEVVYRVFMAAYGLMFPAYVAVVAWPAGSGGRAVVARTLMVFGVVVLAAAWFYWMGFVARHTWWVVGGVGLVLVGAVVRRFGGVPKLKAES